MARSKELLILERSLKNYKGNSVLLVPALISAFSAEFTNAVRRGILPVSDFVLQFLALLVGVVVGVSCTAGLAVMSANVITTGKCKLSDWQSGIGRYFWRTLGITLLVGVLIGVGAIIPYLMRLQLNAPRMLDTSIFVLFSSVFGTLGYVCYAAAVIGNASPISSIKIGWRTLWASGRVFAMFVVLSLILSGAYAIIQNTQGTFTDLILSSSAAGSLTLSRLGYSIVEGFLSPLWFLMGFNIYNQFNQPAAKNQDQKRVAGPGL